MNFHQKWLKSGDFGPFLIDLGCFFKEKRRKKLDILILICLP